VRCDMFMKALKDLFLLAGSDVVCFLTGLLLGGEPTTRAWLSQFVRAGQKRRSCPPALTRLRQELTRRLAHLLAACHAQQLPAEHVLEATALLRLYAALRGIAGRGMVGGRKGIARGTCARGHCTAAALRGPKGHCR
jgi:hypothetical protein